MGFLNLTGLTPGKTYDIAVRAKSPDGIISANSIVYTFTAPSTNIDGTQLVASNNSVVSKIVSSTPFTASAYAPGTSVQGGALTAGPLDDATLAIVGGINLLDYWNGNPGYIGYYISGSENHGAVIINETGILGTKLNNVGSTPKFLLSTDTGDAYFAGTLSAPDGMIGGFHIGATSLSNTVGDNTISINSGDYGYPSFQIVGASSSLSITGDVSNPQIYFNNDNTTQYSDLLIKAGAIASPDFGPTASNKSRGEILFWGANSANPNQITLRRFAESGLDGPDGLTFIDMQTNGVVGTPDYARIGMFAGQSISTGSANDTQPNDNQGASFELYKTFGDTSASLSPAYAKISVNEDGSYNSINMYKQNTSFLISDGGRSSSVNFSSTKTQFTSPIYVNLDNSSSDYAAYFNGNALSNLVLMESSLYSSKPILTIRSVAGTGNQLEFKDLYNNVISYFDNNGKFFGISSSAIAVTTPSDSPPSSPVSGQLWYETDTNRLFTWYVDSDSSQWVEVSGGVSLGNLFISGSNSQTISGSVTNEDITLSPSGSGRISLNGYLKFPDGTIQISAAPAHNFDAYSTVDQTNPVANTPRGMTFNTIDNVTTLTGSADFTITSGSIISTKHTATYNIQFTAQAIKTDAGNDDIYIWLRQDGQDVPESGGIITVAGNNGKIVSGWNYVVQATASSTFTLMWAAADTNLYFAHTASATSPYTRPGVPSTTVTFTEIK
jgi:hypothetical protein